MALIVVEFIGYYSFSFEHAAHVDEELAASGRTDEVLVDEQRLHGVAGRWVVAFGVAD